MHSEIGTRSIIHKLRSFPVLENLQKIKILFILHQHEAIILVMILKDNTVECSLAF